MQALTRAQARAVDRLAMEQCGIGSLVLMENAGLLATLELMPLLEGREGPVVVLCGAGNNGGDGYVIARQLLVRGVRVEVYSSRSAAELNGDAAANRSLLQALGVAVQDLRSEDEVQRTATVGWERAALFVDALLGTGSRGPIRPPLGAFLEALGRARRVSGAPVVAVDLPSGMDCDTGEALGPVVPADLTLTFVAPKVGLETTAGRALTGAVRVLPIGIPQALVRAALDRED